MRRFFRSLTIFDSGVSIAQSIGTVIWLLLVGGSGTATGWLAKNAPIIAQFGPLAWVCAGILAALSVAIILAVMQWSNKQLKYSEYLSAMSGKIGVINPLDHSFNNSLIRIEDLRLPGVMLHERKLFKKVKFVGPGAIAIIGGGIINNNFHQCGDVIAFNDSTITGVPVLKGCTVEDCEFFRTTILADRGTASAMKANGFPVSGL
jgi:hypothetical protein